MDKWISVTEREPPKDGTRIIICDINSGANLWISVIEWVYDSWEYAYSEPSFESMFTHWQPLPKHINS